MAPNRVHILQHWVARRLGTIRHEQRVARIAAHLFDLTAHLHGLGSVHRRMLRMGALLHDVGRYYGSRRHHIRGCRMILESSRLPLNAVERRAAAYLARYHRKRVPRAEEQSFVECEDERRAFECLLAILRTADALDSRLVVSPALTMRLVGRRLSIHCFVKGRWRDTCRAFRKRRKFRLLKEHLDVRVEVELRKVDAPEMVPKGTNRLLR